MRSSGSKRSLRVAFAVLLVLAALAIAAPAALAHGSIAGTVTSVADGTPLENINVYAFDPALVTGLSPALVPDLSKAAGMGVTDGAGQYVILDLPGGPIANPTEYLVWFQDMIPFNHYVAQWFLGCSPYDPNRPAPTLVPVVDNERTLGIDDALVGACTISGNVGGIPGIEVYVWTPEMGSFQAISLRT